ncbi:Zn-ribbon domain-containing OB-fold protein [Novosphingobium sp.]|uniref:Zn-ribbon domain-containing OB-fold protein n=1 Tax=Novosphingobium sp. TaxID=1874826 RepID=UPI002B47AAB0|nr:OB-fold domain-containing protein [Novosphingobium sp.]HKR91518.1 OB-fold domain-containing protein [Novosphingobium sp.]
MAAFVPVPDILTQPYWDGCKNHVITVQQCQSCGRKRHRPAAGCHWCGGQGVDWVQLSGRGSLYTYTVVHRAFHPSLAEEVPYVVGLVAAEEDPTVRFHTRILACDPADVQVGMSLKVLFQEEPDGTVLPYWRPSAA